VRHARALVVTALAGAVALGGVSAAEASPAKPASATMARSASTPLSIDGVMTRALAAGCYGQTDQPHPSTHVPGTVNVVARTVCPGFGVSVYTALYRDRWYGEQFLDDGGNSGTNSVSTNASWRCAGAGTYTYRAYSYHEASDGAYAYTYNSRRFTC
jgi:hypothetical protein